MCSLDVRWPGSGLDVRPMTSFVPGRSHMALSIKRVSDEVSCLSSLNLLSNKSPSHSRNHMLVACAVAEAHWQKRELKCKRRKSPAKAGTSVQVSKLGNDHLPEDATAWPRLLRARDRVCAQSASSSSPPTSSPTPHIIPNIPTRMLDPWATPPHSTNSHVNRHSHSSECHVLYCTYPDACQHAVKDSWAH